MKRVNIGITYGILFILFAGCASRPSYSPTEKIMESLINKQLESYKKLDVEGMMPYFHANIEMFMLTDNRLTDKGLDAVREKYNNFFKQSPNLTFELLSRKLFKNYIIDHERLTGFLSRPDAVEAIVIYQVEDELIRRVWIGI